MADNKIHQTQDPKHKPFSWLGEPLSGNNHAEFAALAKTVCIGVVTCLEIVQRNGMLLDNDDMR